MRTWTSDRLLLRQLGPESAETVADYLTRSRGYHAPWDPVRPADWWDSQRVEERLADELSEAAADRQLVVYLSVQDDPERVIGRVALNNIIRGAFQCAAAGYALAPEATGKGYMTEALRRMADIAFDDLNLHRLEVNVVVRNDRSIAVAERCGFERECVSPRFLRIAGVWEDHVRFVKLNDRWEPR